uniref:Ig-like domain-containing protein n=1 Tax=Maylandia zebra TaxID=106582 RepID=A0A3P9D102_9CICH
SGQNVTLTCRAPQGKPIRAVKWSRADLGDKYVLLYRDELFDQTSQHPSFKNRVDLRDKQMKDGDVSLILKDVTIKDAGTYECRVIVGESASWEIVGTVNMSVLPPGEPETSSFLFHLSNTPSFKISPKESDCRCNSIILSVKLSYLWLLVIKSLKLQFNVGSLFI